MKRIPLRVLPDPAAPDVEQAAVRSADIIGQIVRTPQDRQKGVDIDEMRRGIRILDALDLAAGVLELEDADYQHLKEKTLAMQWGMVDRRLMRCINDILEATDEIDHLANDWGQQAATARDLVNRAS